MEHLDTVFMMIGVIYTCYLLMEVLLKLEYQRKRRRRRAQCSTVCIK